LELIGKCPHAAKEQALIVVNKGSSDLFIKSKPRRVLSSCSSTFELNPVMASTFSGIPSLPGLFIGAGQLLPRKYPGLPMATSVDLFTPVSQPKDQANDNPGEKPGKRKRDDKEYQHGSDYYHNLFDTDWAAEKGLDSQDAILQERVAQEQERVEWQKEHDERFGHNKKSNDKGTVPADDTSASASPSPPEEQDPETRRWHEVIEKLKRTDPIRRRPTVAPSKNVTSAENGNGATKNPPKGVKFAPGVVNPEDRPGPGTPQGPVTTAVETPTETETTKRRTERFRPHPRLPRTDRDFEEAICLLKRMMTEWTREYFFNKLDEAEKREFNLYECSQRSPHLMEYAGWIAAGGDTEKWKSHFVGWRALLVFGILGKMLEVHVFGHTMFGATPAQLETLEAMDLQLLNVDGNDSIPTLTSYITEASAKHTD